MLLREVHEKYCEKIRGHNGRVVLNRRNFIYIVNNNSIHTVKFIFLLNFNCIILSERTVTVWDKTTYVFPIN